MKVRWEKLGGQLGIGYCLAGIALIFLGWNGAASYDRVESQMPYLISGGLAGVALVIIGAGLLIVQAQRANRAATAAEIADLREAVERLATGGGAPAPKVSGGSGDVAVIAGPSAYHAADCRLIEGQASVATMFRSEAKQRGLSPCRICAPG
ncbi:MAG: hypothetical protein ACT4PI_17620 [Actinomycetota bacterium]